MKKIIFAVLFCLLLYIPVNAEEYLEYTAPEISLNIQTAGIKIKFPNGEGRDNVYCNGRICVSLEEGARLMGGEYINLGYAYKLTVGDKSVFFNVDNTSNRPKAFIYNNRPFISLYELITPFNYEMIVDLNDNSVSVLKYNSAVYINPPVKEGSSAYIRLEDIAADGLKPDGSAKYSVSMLEKLKYTAEYLYLSGQKYYIGWIPVYVCPELNYSNDISVYYNLYNSYFIYVLDYMTDHNGHLGLHGYTHQYGNDESGDGYEWGAATPYSVTEQQERMILAKQSSARLGYTPEFFEFPHYEATNEQLLMAEHYFDVVYQNYPDIYKAGEITCTERSGKTVYYIPTPAGYVRYKRDDSIYTNIDYSIKSGNVLSLYFHPIIDEDNISVTEYNNTRYWCYESEAALPSILSYIQNLGYNFSSFGF